MESEVTSNVILMHNSTIQPAIFRGLITNEGLITFQEVLVVYTILMAIFGIATNGVNIKTFISMGVEDGVTVSFLVLSLSDLTYLVALLIRAVSLVFNLLEKTSDYTILFPVQPYALYIVFANVAIMLYPMTVLVTTFLAVARCMCVAKPLHFKNSFTTKRSVLILTAFAVFTVFSYVPIFYYMGIFDQYDANIGAVRPKLFVSPKRELAKDIIWGIRDTGMSFATQFIVIICVVVLTKSLQESSKFRQASTRAGVGDNSKKNNSDNKKDSSNNNDNRDNGAGSGKLSGKDLQVVQQVVLISFVYVVCNMPKIIATTAGFMEAEFTLGKLYNNVYVMIVSLTQAFQMINSSINVFIYYEYNSKFRSCCNFCTCKNDD